MVKIFVMFLLIEHVLILAEFEHFQKFGHGPREQQNNRLNLPTFLLLLTSVHVLISTSWQVRPCIARKLGLTSDRTQQFVTFPWILFRQVLCHILHCCQDLILIPLDAGNLLRVEIRVAQSHLIKIRRI